MFWIWYIFDYYRKSNKLFSAWGQATCRLLKDIPTFCSNNFFLNLTLFLVCPTSSALLKTTQLNKNKELKKLLIFLKVDYLFIPTSFTKVENILFINQLELECKKVKESIGAANLDQLSKPIQLFNFKMYGIRSLVILTLK